MNRTRTKCPNCCRHYKWKHECKKCEFCGQRYVKKHECRALQCNQCGLYFKDTHTCKKRVIKCRKCDYQTNDRALLREHYKRGHLYKCPVCDFKHARLAVIKNHYLDTHKTDNSSFQCSYCSFSFNKKEHYQSHVMSHAETDFVEKQKAFSNTCVSYGAQFKGERHKTIAALFEKYNPQLLAILKCCIEARKSIKVSIVLFAILQKIDSSTGGIVTENEFIFRSKQSFLSVLSNDREIQQVLDTVRNQAEELFDGYCDMEGSGWTLSHISELYLDIAECRSLSGGHQSTPFKSEYVWDGPSNECECFYNAVARHFHVKGLTSDTEISAFVRSNFPESLTGQPVTTQAICKFEKKYDLQVNVILFQSGEMYPIRISKRSEKNDPINLLMIPSRSSYALAPFHYIYILDLNSLISELVYNLRKKSIDGKKNSKIFVCISCLNFFSRKEALKAHEPKCIQREAQSIQMPEKNSSIQFSKVVATQKIPIIGAFDFETKMIPGIGSTRHSKNINSHRAVSYSIVLINLKNEVVYEKTELSEEDCLEKFIASLNEISKMIYETCQNTIKIIISPTEEAEFQQSKICYICRKSLDGDRVRDHCHFTGKYFGPAHNECNIKRVHNFKVPIFAHNFSGYDSHFVIEAIAKHAEVGELNVLAYNSQRIRTLDYNRISFIDSMHFISDSLDNIIKDLVQSNHEFPILRNSLLYSSEEQRSLLLKKGVFPYEKLTSLSAFEDMTEFPPKTSFYSNLREKGVSDEDYEHGRRVFKTFKCKNMAKYLELYNILDTYLLLEGISAFRNVGWNELGLDACHFISLPQFGFQCMLHHTGQKLSLISDIDMLLFLEDGIRGGVSYCSTRLAELDSSNASRRSMVYVDANNLYGLAQIQPLPTGCYRWGDEHDLMTVLNIIHGRSSDNGKLGYILEVDLKYPEELHDHHQDMPLAPEHFCITNNVISPLMVGKSQYGQSYRAKKLVGTLNDKKSYIVHYKLLKYYIQSGLKIKKVKKILTFEQSAFMNGYISHLARLRSDSCNSFEKSVLKKLANSCYGKMIENVRKYKIVKVCQTRNSFLKSASSPFFEGFKIYNDQLAFCFLKKPVIYMKSFHAVGLSILDYSKLHMYQLYYDHIIPLTGLSPSNGTIQVVMSDTDSFLLLLKNMSADQFYRSIESIMDFSNYPKTSKFYSTEVAGRLGFLKDETKGQSTITGVIALKAKCYSIKTNSSMSLNKLKGVSKVATSKLSYDDYKNTLMEQEGMRLTFSKITTKDHKVSTTQLSKSALTFYDDKRFYTCSIHSLPYGHYKVKRDKIPKCHRC